MGAGWEGRTDRRCCSRVGLRSICFRDKNSEVGRPQKRLFVGPARAGGRGRLVASDRGCVRRGGRAGTWARQPRLAAPRLPWAPSARLQTETENIRTAARLRAEQLPPAGKWVSVKGMCKLHSLSQTRLWWIHPAIQLYDYAKQT